MRTAPLPHGIRPSGRRRRLRPVCGGRARAAQRPRVQPRLPEGRPAPRSCDSGVSSRSRPSPSGLEHPWGIALLPDGGYLVTERPGRLRVVAPDGTLSEPVAGPAGGAGRGPGRPARRRGLARPSPRTASSTGPTPSPWREAARPPPRRAAGCPRTAHRVTDVQDVFVQDPPSPTTKHYGSRVILDGAGHLFVTTGEHQTAEQSGSYAQDLDTTYGKVVRINLDGTPPADNPFAGRPRPSRPIWSLGHRNIQGAALDADGQLWTDRARAQGRRRAEPHRARRELRLAGDQLRRELQRLAGRRGPHGGRGDGAAALLLGPGDRPRRHDLLRRRHVPGLAGRRPDRRDEPRARWCGSTSTATR